MKHTKKALLTSALCLLLCMSMLIGTTFAWFTDEVSSGKNQIIAGNLDIEVEYSHDGANWNNLQGATDLFGTDLWEPGRVDVVYFRVTNAGTLKLKYNLAMSILNEIGSVNVNGAAFKLSDYIKFGIKETSAVYPDRAAAVADVEASAKNIKEGFATPGTMEPNTVSKFALVVYMPSTVGNEANYRGNDIPTIDLGITMVATQFQGEQDSFGPTYDDAADFPILSSPEVVPAAGNVALKTSSNVEVKVPVTMLPANVTSIQLAHSAPVVDSVTNTVSFDAAELVDQDGDVVELQAIGAETMTVKLPVSGIANGTAVAVYHDGELVATPVVADGFITYEASHFCQIIVQPITLVGTAAELESAVANGGTIILNADIALSNILVIDKANTVLDGQGKYTLTSSADRGINVSGANGVIIKNLTVNASGERAINIIKNATNVTIENVVATAANYTVNVASSAPNAVVTIQNSTLSGKCTVNVASPGASVAVADSTINCIDDNTTAGESYAALSLGKESIGGQILATSCVINVTADSDSIKAKNAAVDGVVTIDGSSEDVMIIVAAITYPSPYYYGFASLADAIAFAKDGDYIQLIRDIELNADEPIKIEKALTIDLNGKTLSGKSTTSTTSYMIEVKATGALTLNGEGTVSFYATTPDINWGGVGQPAFPGYANNTIKNSGTLVIDGPTVQNITAPGGASYAIDCYQGSSLTLNSGLIDGKGKCAIRMFCNSNTLSTNVTINGGTVTGKRAVWVHLPSSNINNVRPVNLTITGGKLICNDIENDVCVYSYSYGDSFAGTNITISGGEFVGAVCFGGGNAKTTQENVTVTGGIFHNELGRYLADGGWEDIAKP